MKNKLKPIALLSCLILALLFLFAGSNLAKESRPLPSADTNRIITLEELKKYNGDNQNLPIYIGMNGYVYDVTAGKKFYQPGGSYHDLAGRDSSTELNMAGGGIIKSKYPVVGRLAQ